MFSSLMTSACLSTIGSLNSFTASGSYESHFFERHVESILFRQEKFSEGKKHMYRKLSVSVFQTCLG